MDEGGRTIAYGFSVQGAPEAGYQATSLDQLTDDELAYGALHILHSDNLFDLLARCKGQHLLRIGIRRALQQTRHHLETEDDTSPVPLT